MMEQCRTCLDREYKDELICCQCNHIAHAFREMLKSLPVVGKNVPDYECRAYEKDEMQ